MPQKGLEADPQGSRIVVKTATKQSAHGVFDSNMLPTYARRRRTHQTVKAESPKAMATKNPDSIHWNVQ